MIILLLLSSLLWAEEVKIPPPEFKPKPVAKIPSAFRNYTGDKRSSLEIEKAVRPELRSLIYVTSMVMESLPESFGEIVIADTNTNTVGPFQNVLIRSNRVSPGQTYSVVKDMGELKISSNVTTVQGTPHAIQIQGEVKILGTVIVPKLKETLWRAQVTKSYNPLEMGSHLSEIKVPRVDLTQRGVPARVDGEVIGGALNLSRRLLEPGATVYLSSGIENGARVGQLLEVYSTQNLYSVRSAMVRVAYVDQDYATGVIVTADREVQPGDRLTRPE